MIIFLLVSSCSEKKKNEFVNIVGKADKLQITFTSGSKNVFVPLTSELKKIFQDVFEGKGEKCKCLETGRLRFYSKDGVILVADFSTMGKDMDTNKDCEYLFVVPGEGSCYRLSYHAGMFIDNLN